MGCDTDAESKHEMPMMVCGGSDLLPIQAASVEVVSNSGSAKDDKYNAIEQRWKE